MTVASAVARAASLSTSSPIRATVASASDSRTTLSLGYPATSSSRSAAAIAARRRRSGRGQPRLVIGADADDQRVAVLEAHRARRGLDVASPPSTPHPSAVRARMRAPVGRVNPRQVRCVRCARRGVLSSGDGPAGERSSATWCRAARGGPSTMAASSILFAYGASAGNGPPHDALIRALRHLHGP